MGLFWGYRVALDVHILKLISDKASVVWLLRATKIHWAHHRLLLLLLYRRLRKEGMSILLLLRELLRGLVSWCKLHHTLTQVNLLL